MENFSLLDTEIPYVVKTLIAVNSINYCYAELPIDRHCALFGGNNLGKTSLLNALKLHLFPEISFHDCQRKFAFKSTKGELYSPEDSYIHYFPTDNSFLILEAENIHGEFCLILFKSNSSFGYQRLALPCAYDVIRNTFWDIDSTEVNNGLGSPVSDLGIPAVMALYQQYKSSGAELLKTKKELKDRLFSHNPMNLAKGRYCLVPLKEGGMERELEAFRQLMNFTFDVAKADTKSLTETIATIIESGKINKQDVLHQDLQIILSDYNTLREQQDTLKARENFHDDFISLRNLSSRLLDDQLMFAHTHYAYTQHLVIQKTQATDLLTTSEPNVNSLLLKMMSLREENTELQKQGSGLNAQIELLKRSLLELNKKKDRLSAIQKEYPADFKINDIKCIFQEEDAKLAKTITDCVSTQSANEKLINLVGLLTKKATERDRKKGALERREKLLISQLSEYGALVLDAINPHFSEITVDHDEQQLDVIERFCALFSVNQANPANLDMLGGRFMTGTIRSQQQQRQTLQDEIDELIRGIGDTDADIKKMKDFINGSPEVQLHQLAKVKRESQLIKDDLLILNTIEDTNTRWQTITDEVRLLENGHLENKANLSINADSQATSKTEHLLAKEAHAIQSKQLSDASALLFTLAGIKPDEALSEGNHSIDQVTKNHLITLEDNFFKLNSTKEHINKAINRFLCSNHFDLPIPIAYNSYSKEQQLLIVDKLTSIFAELPSELDALTSNIINHNKTTGAKITELKGNRDHIHHFTNKINKQFEQYTISNLKNIHVEIELDHRFEELVNELSYTNLHTGDIHNDALYQRLNQFCEDFFVGSSGGRIMEISKIIKNVRYSYIKEHNEKRQDKDQSTGTNALINCTLLTILMRDLLAQESKLMLPIVFDEFTNLDAYNQQTAIQVATEHGFALFCAAASQSAEVVNVVDCFICLDDFHANTTYDSTGERDVVFHHFWERLYDALEEPQ